MFNSNTFYKAKARLPFGQSGFCEVDALVLSALAYLDFSLVEEEGGESLSGKPPGFNEEFLQSDGYGCIKTHFHGWSEGVVLFMEVPEVFQGGSLIRELIRGFREYQQKNVKMD